MPEMARAAARRNDVPGDRGGLPRHDMRRKIATFNRLEKWQ